MPLKELENLVKAGQLKPQAMAKNEFDGLYKSGKARLNDANNFELSIESRFDLAYNAGHSLAVAALRWHGYRSANRFIVFQALPHSLNLGPEVWRVLAKCHERRNAAEYEGYLDIDDRLLTDLLTAANTLQHALEQLIQS